MSGINEESRGSSVLNTLISSGVGFFFDSKLAERVTSLMLRETTASASRRWANDISSGRKKLSELEYYASSGHGSRYDRRVAQQTKKRLQGGNY